MARLELAFRAIRGNTQLMPNSAMYLIAVLRETPPDLEVARFAARLRTNITNESKRLPESPVCFKPAGYSRIGRTLGINSPTYELLNMARIITNKFFANHAHQTQTTQTPFRTARFFDQSDDSILALRDQIFALPSGVDMDYFQTMHDRYTYEAIRLTSLIYAHALATHLPFSVAADQLRSNSSPPKSDVPLPANDLEDDIEASLPLRIRKALMRTNLAGCWESLRGVLLWISLIAGAASNSGPADDSSRTDEVLEARKWFAAISVRCNIVMSFDHSAAILETLKRLVGIESVLTLETLDSGSDWFTTPPIVNGTAQNGDVVFGPQEVLQSLADIVGDPTLGANPHGEMLGEGG